MSTHQRTTSELVAELERLIYKYTQGRHIEIMYTKDVWLEMEGIVDELYHRLALGPILKSNIAAHDSTNRAKTLPD